MLPSNIVPHNRWSNADASERTGYAAANSASFATVFMLRANDYNEWRYTRNLEVARSLPKLYPADEMRAAPLASSVSPGGHLFRPASPYALPLSGDGARARKNFFLGGIRAPCQGDFGRATSAAAGDITMRRIPGMSAIPCGHLPEFSHAVCSSHSGRRLPDGPGLVPTP